jgi:vitamin B12 transporter
MLCGGRLQISSRTCDRKRIAAFLLGKAQDVPLNQSAVREGRNNAVTRKSGDLPSPSFVRPPGIAERPGFVLRCSDQWDVGLIPRACHSCALGEMAPQGSRYIMTFKQKLLAASLLISAKVALVAPAFAQTTPASVTEAAAETIIVSATRSSQAKSKVGSSVTLIDEASLTRAQTISVTDILRDVPGVTFSRNGGVGTLTSVRIRGAEADQTVVLIDGIKLNDPSGPGGGYNFANLLAGDVARIEVLRGPQSTLYGSQAMGGVVNVITRSGDVLFGANLELEGGDLSTYRGRGSVRGKLGGLSYAAGLSHFETVGMSSAASGTEADSFTNDGAQARVNYVVNANLELEARLLWSDSDVGIDGFPAPSFALADTPERSTTEELIAYVGGTLTLLDGRSRTRFSVSQTTTDRANINPALAVATTFDATGSNDRIEIQSIFDVSPNFQIVAGTELEEARLRTASPTIATPNPTPLRAKSELSAYYIQGQASPTSWLTATLGLRQTSNDRFGEALNVRATVAASFNEGNTIVRGAIADGFKAPTPFQLFSNFGNTTLLPEEAASVELGLEQAFFSRRLVAAITAFERDTTNQIDFISCFNNPIAICVGRPSGTYNNIAKTKADGIEATIEVKPSDRFTLSAGYSTLDARNAVVGNANFNRRLTRRAKETGFVTMGYGFAFGLEVSATYSMIGDSFNNASNSQLLKGYELITLRASQRIGDTWTIFARIENATDDTYQTVRDYNSPPRQAFVGLRASF